MRTLILLAAVLLAARVATAQPPPATVQPAPTAAQPPQSTSNAAQPTDKPAFSAEDLIQLRRISAVEASPDGTRVSFTIRSTDLAANAGRLHIGTLEVKHRGGTPRMLTDGAFNDNQSAWSADSKTLYFLSDRSGSSQVWRIGVDGGAPVQMTRLPLDVGSFRVAPRTDRIVVSLAVFIDCPDLACTVARLDRAAHHVASGQAFERIFVRHWDTWSDGRRSQLFTLPLDGNGIATGEAVDISGALDGDVPSKPDGDNQDYVISPDGRTVVFSMRVAPAGEPWSTNFDLFETPITGGAAPRNLTADNPAEDVHPTFSPDGKTLAWLAMDRAGAESDRRHLVLLNLADGRKRLPAPDWDVSIDALCWSRDGKHLLASADYRGQKALWSVDAISGKTRALSATGHVDSFSAAARTVYFTRSDLARPADLYGIGWDGNGSTRLTDLNGDTLSARSLGNYQRFEFAGANQDTVSAYLVEPAGFESGQHYPLALMIHGGPETSMANEWHWRWNAQSIAGAGYGVLMIDYHGSSGYGQKFTDSIVKDWGGKPFEDIQRGVAAAIAAHSWIDPARLCAIGGSYGGYMVEWIAGNWPERFKCLVAHSGIFDTRGMYYSTEELWFPEWENGGPEYAKPSDYSRFNPMDHVAAWQTPILVVHGERDFRVPFAQGLAAFTAAQRRGIPSQLLVYPDENHWILKPANSLQWYEAVIAWMNRWTAPAPPSAAAEHASTRAPAPAQASSKRQAAG